MDLTIKFTDVQAALTKCLDTRPVETSGSELCLDAQLLSEIYGLMAMSHAELCPLSQITPEQKAALKRWTT